MYRDEERGWVCVNCGRAMREPPPSNEEKRKYEPRTKGDR